MAPTPVEAGAPAAGTLYGADGAGGNASNNLLILDPATGAVQATIGPIGYGVTGLAVHPATGALYGVTGGADPTKPGHLITINTATGAGTVVGDLHAVTTSPVADIAFHPDGTLYGWSEAQDELVTINLTTGEATFLGAPGFGTYGSGLGITSAGTVYFAGDADGGLFRTLDRTTGTALSSLTLTGGSGRAISALAANCTDQLYAVGLESSGGGGAAYLATINPATGVITQLGPAPAGLDAIVFDCAVPQALLGMLARTVTEALGDGDGRIDANETINLAVTLENSGSVGATGISSTLSTGTPGVMLTQASSAYPDLAPGASAANSTTFQFSTTPSFLEGTAIILDMAITTNQGPFAVQLRLATGRPVYGADGGGARPSSLVILDPNTGQVAQTVGSIGFSVTGLAQHPTTGVLYGVTGCYETPSGHLIVVNTATGQGTLVGPVNNGNCGPADITFASDGTLYGWSRNGDDLYTINLTTGAGTLVGESGIGGSGFGLAARRSDNTLFLAADGIGGGAPGRPAPAGGAPLTGELRTVDRATGLTTVVATMDGSSPDGRMSAMAFNCATTLFGVHLPDYGGGPAELLTVDTSSGVLTTLGPTRGALDALEFACIDVTSLVRIASRSIEDSLGNGNGFVDRNETVDLTVLLKEVAGKAATGVSAVLTTSTPGVTVTNGTANYPDLLPGVATAQSGPPFAFTTSGALVVGNPIVFNLAVTTNQGVFNLALSVRSDHAVLYAANGSCSGSSTLVTLDPDTAEVLSTIGTISDSGVTGLAQHPTTGVLYGVTDQCGTSPRSLITIDKTTGAGTVVGPLGTNVTDIEFDRNGNLYGFSRDRGDLLRIDMATGAATSIGDFSCSYCTYGDGLAINAAGTMYVAPNGFSGQLHTVDPVTGLSTGSVNLVGAGGASVNSLTSNCAGNMLYGSSRDGTVNRIDPATGNVTVIGAPATRFDALLWVEPCFVVEDLMQLEGNSAGTASFNVRQLYGDGSAFAVSFSTADGTATAPSDYTSTSGTLNFAPGETSKLAVVPTAGDTIAEPSESFFLNLASLDVAIGRSQATGVLVDDETPRTLSIDDVTLLEGNAGTTDFVFTVTLSAASDVTGTVAFTTANGTATSARGLPAGEVPPPPPGGDYEAISGGLTFPPGSTVQTITVVVNGDMLFEGDETFLVNLTSANFATIADGQGVGTITNDDAAPPGPPTLDPVPGGVITIGDTATLSGTNFTGGTVVKLFVNTGSSIDDVSGPGGFMPTSLTPTSLSFDIPTSVPPGQGFGSLFVVNTDQGFATSDTEYALLYGDAADNIPTIQAVNETALSTTLEPGTPVAHTDTVVTPSSTVLIDGTGFNNPGVNLFGAPSPGPDPAPTVDLCPVTNYGPFFPGGTATSFEFTLPPGVAAGPASFQVVNSPYTGSVVSNAVLAVAAAQATITSVTLEAPSRPTVDGVTSETYIITGTGFSCLSVINLFNLQGPENVVNLGGITAGGQRVIPLQYISSTELRFTRPPGAVAGPAFVEVLNPPFIAFSSSGNDPEGAFSFP